MDRVFDKFGLVGDDHIFHIARTQDVVLDRFQFFCDGIGHGHGVGIRCSVDGSFDAFPAVDARDDLAFFVAAENVCNAS